MPRLIRKTVSLPPDLMRYAECDAKTLGMSISQYFAMLLSGRRSDQLASGVDVVGRGSRAYTQTRLEGVG